MSASTLTSGRIRTALSLPSGVAQDRTYTGVSTDSRRVAPGDLFVAIRGERVDGADFLPQAAAAGAAGAIISANGEHPDLSLEYFAVADPVHALGDLASNVRSAASARVIAVTGSSGKTTVKEMLSSALGEACRVYRTEGNLNSQVGLPLTILRAPRAANFWILELGASEPGEIARLTAIAAPDDVVVTTVGPAHLEAFGDEARVMDEKLDLVRGASTDGAVVVGELPVSLARAAREIRPTAIVAGLGPEADYRPDRFEVGPERVWFERSGVRAQVDVGGEHHLRDALMAAAVAEAVDIPLDSVARGLARYRPLGHRGAVRRIGDLTVLADCYNANPESFGAAIAQCRDLYPGRRLAAFVGSMLELGDHEIPAHREVGAALSEAGFSPIAATGCFAPAFDDAALASGGVVAGEGPDDVWEEFAQALTGDEVVLVKASRGARLERVLDWLEDRFGARNGRTAGGGR
ncbi:MAG: UDP-N-acetylmuramoyl-tripeptide--D-alanyl-D-alanine ligase [Gemmatimonadota bacterium]|nr:UDP-N-acetylmuramoyl-tripeptide--D-alanyl-D-alanine ligase [Gemmatimonadota bacterium]